MSLTVSPELLERAKAGPVSDAEFLACIEESLPYASQLVNKMIAELQGSDAQFVTDKTPPPSDKDQGELLRLMASDPMRRVIERHYGVKLAFQNCCKVGVFRPEAENGEAWNDFMSARGQLLNQTPELVNC